MEHRSNSIREKTHRRDTLRDGWQSQQPPPPAYCVVPPVDGSKPGSYPLPDENSQMLAANSSTDPSKTRKRSPTRAALDVIKGIFSTGTRDAKDSMEGSQPPSPGPCPVGEPTNNVILQLAGMSIRVAGAQAISIHLPSPGHTPRSEHPPSSSTMSSQCPSQATTPRNREHVSSCYFTTGHVTNNQLLALKDFDTQFLIDDSGSMRLSTSTIHKGKTHWEEVNDVLSNVVEICARNDKNGVDVFFFNSSLVGQFNGRNIKNPHEVMQLFEARRQAGIRGSTPTAEALDLIIAPYLSECEQHAEDQKFPQPRNIIVMTDGAANNNKLLKQNLINYAKRLDAIGAPPHQLGIQFFQVGNVDGVDEFLMFLDNSLSEINECRDFIDTKSTEDMGEEGLTAKRVLTTVLGGVNRSKSIITPVTTEYGLAADLKMPQNQRQRRSRKCSGEKDRDRDGIWERDENLQDGKERESETLISKKSKTDGKSRRAKRDRARKHREHGHEHSLGEH